MNIRHCCQVLSYLHDRWNGRFVGLTPVPDIQDYHSNEQQHSPSTHCTGDYRNWTVWGMHMKNTMTLMSESHKVESILTLKRIVPVFAMFNNMPFRENFFQVIALFAAAEDQNQIWVAVLVISSQYYHQCLSDFFISSALQHFTYMLECKPQAEYQCPNDLYPSPLSSILQKRKSRILGVCVCLYGFHAPPLPQPHLVKSGKLACVIKQLFS